MSYGVERLDIYIVHFCHYPFTMIVVGLKSIASSLLVLSQRSKLKKESKLTGATKRR